MIQAARLTFLGGSSRNEAPGQRTSAPHRPRDDQRPSGEHVVSVPASVAPGLAVAQARMSRTLAKNQTSDPPFLLHIVMLREHTACYDD